MEIEGNLSEEVIHKAPLATMWNTLGVISKNGLKGPCSSSVILPLSQAVRR